ncbi:serine/threonine-protein kinase Pink1, mitochondrial [Prorops nasuta]|uniref:serine/threonine-protein kinase Pink1, mitochondrial n=1 Tax=Prorops nasuta TaxID=863751 RepID=UPI0034CDDCD5
MIKIVTIKDSLPRIIFRGILSSLISPGTARWAVSVEENLEMSIRTVANRFVQNGRAVFRIIKNKESTHINGYSGSRVDKIHVLQVGKSQGSLPQDSHGSTAVRNFASIGAHARRIFVDNILKRVTNSLAADLRRRTASRLVFGDSAPFFALVGVSLASGTGILTKDDELEGVCWEIREAIGKLQWNKPENDRIFKMILVNEVPNKLNSFVIGPPISKGSSAVVYAARPRDKDDNDNSNQIKIEKQNTNLANFPFALKMMFNYDAESNSTAILRSMFKETVPAWKHYSKDELTSWEQSMAESNKILPPHPNIVSMYSIFVDHVQLLPESWRMYPDALPTRINPDGSGRNMSLFLVMKRYNVTLKQHLYSQNLKLRESILLFAQLLEGIFHMNSHGIAHRDLKSDNILLDLSEETENCPSLVIADFGSCLADKSHGLYLPYNTHDIDKGGNAALMAPEVITTEPGPFTSINYTKADLWSAGAIAYEIFGLRNPFYGDKTEKAKLTNLNYSDEELPVFPSFVPNVIAVLIKNILSRNINKRLDPETAATVIQLYLWAPSSWLKNEIELPSSNELMQWLLSLTTKVLCEDHNNALISKNLEQNHSAKDVQSFYKRSLSTRTCGRRTMPEYQLIASFLTRVRLSNIRNALKWIQKFTRCQSLT